MYRCSLLTSHLPRSILHRLSVFSANLISVRGMASVRDPNTQSNYSSFLTTHAIANLDIDFGKKSLSGNFILHLKCLNNADRPDILLDTSYLDVGGVLFNGKPAKWELESRVEPYGSALRIKLEPDFEKDDLELDVG